MKTWSHSEESLLKTYYLSGVNLKDIARKLDRTYISTCSKLRLSDYFQSKSKADLNKLKIILNKVSIYSGLTTELINSKTRKREIVQYRQLCQYYAKLLTKISLAEIGKFFGDKDHSTVLHSEKAILNLIDTDQKFESIHDEILVSIKREFLFNENGASEQLRRKQQIIMIKKSMNIHMKIELNDLLNRMKNGRPIY